MTVKASAALTGLHSALNGDFDKLAPGSEVHFLEDIATEGLQAKRVRTDRNHGSHQQ